MFLKNVCQIQFSKTYTDLKFYSQIPPNTPKSNSPQGKDTIIPKHGTPNPDFPKHGTPNPIFPKYGTPNRNSPRTEIPREFKQYRKLEPEALLTRNLENLIRQNKIQEAEETFLKEMPKISNPDKVLYQTGVKIFDIRKNLNGAISLLEEMQSKNIQPTTKTYNILIHLATRSQNTKFAMKILLEMETLNLQIPLKCYTLILSNLARYKDFENAYQLFKKMEEKKLLTEPLPFNILLGITKEQSKVKEILQFMEKNQVQPDVTTYQLLIRIFKLNRKISEIFKIWDLAKSRGIKGNQDIYLEIMKAAAISGNREKIDETLNEMKEWNVEIGAAIYNWVLFYYVSKGDIEGTKRGIEMMVKDQVEPVEATKSILAKFSGFKFGEFFSALGQKEEDWIDKK